MNRKALYKILPAVLVILLVVYVGCRKQYKCGCGKDVVQNLTDIEVTISLYNNGASIIFYPLYANGSTYYFCNPAEWADSIKKLSSESYLLLSGKAYYDCNYMMQASNYSYLPPVYQVQVTSVRKNNYGK